MKYEAVIGLEVHAEFSTNSKMFCACPVVDATEALPNVAVCPVCAGMPGVLPVVNEMAVEYAVRVALALNCKVANTSIFDRKNYFYPDLPKGYQISQYQYPLAEHGQLAIDTPQGEKSIRITRVHMEEDTGKLTHVNKNGESYSLVDLNRAGVPLLEIVSEPDMRSVEEVRAYATSLRDILRYLNVNSGDMEKGVIRFEANVSVRPEGSTTLGTRTEIKNLNSFRAMERSVSYQIEQQIAKLERGEVVDQETLGWNETLGETYSQRSKEEAHDYRYFPEPDLPPLVIEDEWIDRIKQDLPELPHAKMKRFQTQYTLTEAVSRLMVEDQVIADYFEETVRLALSVPAQNTASWIVGEIFGWQNTSNVSFAEIKVKPDMLAELIVLVNDGKINVPTGKIVLNNMLKSGERPTAIIDKEGLEQISDMDLIADIVIKVIKENPDELYKYVNGKEGLANWFFGKAMGIAKGKANPAILREELEIQLTRLKK